MTFYQVEGNEFCIHRAHPETPQHEPDPRRRLTTTQTENVGTLLSLPAWGLLLWAIWIVIR